MSITFEMVTDECAWKYILSITFEIVTEEYVRK